MSKSNTDQQQLIIAIFVIVTLIVAIAVAMFLGQREKGAGLQSTQRFTAKPGTTRENAVALSSSKRKTEEEGGRAAAPPPASGSGGSRDVANPPPPVSTNEKPMRVRSLSPEEAEAEDETEQSVRAALNDLSPARGIEKLQAMLETELSDDERARVYGAIARLCGELETPDLARQEEALSFAASYAESPKAALEAARNHAEILSSRGDYAGASERVKQAISDLTQASPERAELGIIMGGLMEAQQDAVGAEEAYAAAFKDAKDSASEQPEQREEALRQSGLRLSRIYRATGRSSEADAVAQSLTAALQASP